AQRPSICGKQDLQHDMLVPQAGQLCPATVVTTLARWLQQTVGVAPDDAGTTASREVSRALAPVPSTPTLTRRPYFCSGCPHNTSTKVPKGSQALAGVGCHYMATWM